MSGFGRIPFLEFLSLSFAITVGYSNAKAADLEFHIQRSAEQIEQLRVSASAGDAASMVTIGDVYRDAREPDYSESLTWYHMAADSGSAGAMERIRRRVFKTEHVFTATTHAQWNGTEKQWMQVTLRQSHLSAGSTITGMESRRTTRKRSNGARMAADKGGPEGMNNLGHLPSRDRSRTRDVSRAVELFRKSAEAGNAWGYDNLGVLTSMARVLISIKSRRLICFVEPPHSA